MTAAATLMSQYLQLSGIYFHQRYKCAMCKGHCGAPASLASQASSHPAPQMPRACRKREGAECLVAPRVSRTAVNDGKRK